MVDLIIRLVAQMDKKIQELKDGKVSV